MTHCNSEWLAEFYAIRRRLTQTLVVFATIATLLSTACGRTTVGAAVLGPPEHLLPNHWGTGTLKGLTDV